MSGTERTDTASADYAEIPPNVGLLKVAIILATLMQVLDMTITNVALPHMQAALGANQDTISWVLTSYIVASAIVLPITGWLSDRIGRRRLYLISVGGFIATSILCGLAGSIEQMVLFRLLQGVTGAFLSPLAQTVLLDTTPPEKRGQAMALFGMGVVLGPVMGPVLGGFLTENFNWRWVFFVNIPLGIIAFAGLWLLLPDVRRPARSLDITGFALLAVALASMQLMLDRGEHVDWFSSMEIWIELLIAVSAFWMFGVHLATGRNPLYSRRMLTNRNFIVGVALIMAMGFVLTAAMALLPLMLQGLMGYPVIDAGMLLAVRGIGVLVTMGITGRLIGKVDLRFLVVGGFAIVAATFYEMTFWSMDISWGAMAANGFVQGMGLGMLFVPITTMAFSDLPAEDRTDGSSLINLSRSIGASIGISLVITLLARNSATSHSDLVQHLTPYRLWIDSHVLALPSSLMQAATGILNGEVTRQASMIGFLDDFYFMMMVTICAIPLALLIKRSSRSAGPPPAEIME